MKLHEMKRPKIKKNKKRLGKGQGSGTGTYAGRGLKGQKARSGGSIPNWFEGGQMPIHRRVPKYGFYSRNKKKYRVVNLIDLVDTKESKFDVTTFEELGLVATKGSKKNGPIKLLATGSDKFDKKIDVKVNAISNKAKESIEKLGGKVEIV